MEPGTKLGIAIGLAIMGFASWVHSLGASRTLQNWFPGMWEALQWIDKGAPFIVFLGAWVLFFAIFRRPIVATILSTAIAVILGLLIWG